MFREISGKHPRDKDLPERAFVLAVLRSVVDGSFYDVLRREFHEEKAGDDYVPLRERAPSVRYNLCRIVVTDAATLVFGEERFPRIACEQVEIANALNGLAEETDLPTVMSEAVIAGSVGSVAMWMRILGGRVFWQVMQTEYLTPEWDPKQPDTLLSVTEKYKVKASSLREMGYRIADSEGDPDYWFERVWTTSAEEWYEPRRVVVDPDDKRAAERQLDKSRTVRHGLGFVPFVWIKNLPGGSATGDKCDGLCTFKPAVDTQIEIEYQLSQSGRGLKYSQDPLLLVREPAAPDENFVRSADNALVVSKEGDAKLLEISGGAISAVIEYARFLREIALETIHGNRADPNRFSAAQSGRALETMNHGLIGLAGEIRTSYGNKALIRMFRMVLAAAEKMKVTVGGEKIPEAKGHVKLRLVWPDWYAPSPEERRTQAQSLQTLSQSGHMSRETAVKIVSDTYDVVDPHAELARIKKDQAEADARLAEQQAQTKATEPVSS